MDSFLQYLLSAMALILVIEGLLYALFTDSVRRMMTLALALPPEKLKIFGFFMAGAGFIVLWILMKL
jgi:uncharacterized protein YjeT (DUF2065 family)